MHCFTGEVEDPDADRHVCNLQLLLNYGPGFARVIWFKPPLYLFIDRSKVVPVLQSFFVRESVVSYVTLYLSLYVTHLFSRYW